MRNHFDRYGGSSRKLNIAGELTLLVTFTGPYVLHCSDFLSSYVSIIMRFDVWKGLEDVELWAQRLRSGRGMAVRPSFTAPHCCDLASNRTFPGALSAVF